MLKRPTKIWPYQRQAFILAITINLSACNSELPDLIRHQPSPFQTTRSENVSMILYSDSIGRGFLADTHLGQKLDTGETLRFLTTIPIIVALPLLRRGRRIVPPAVIRLLDRRYARPEWNAFVGSKPWSHRSLLSKKFHQAPKVLNFSQLAATFADGRKQIKQARQAMEEQNIESVDYVIVSLGAMDFCLNEVVADRMQRWRRDIRTFLAELLDLHKNSRIIVTAIPNLAEVMTLQDRVAFRYLGRSMKCHALQREADRLCRWLPSISSSMAALGRARQYLDEFNQLLASETRYAQRQLGGKRQQPSLTFAPLPRLNGQDYQNLLAADCFHPSAKGHEYLAKSTWEIAKQLF